MDDLKQKSFEFANDAVKLILTLATGVLAFTITFLKEIVGNKPLQAKDTLIFSWYILLFSIFCCIWALFAIAGTLDSLSNATSDADKKNVHIYNGNITTPSVLAILSFLFGVLLYIYFAIVNFQSATTKSPNIPVVSTAKTQPSNCCSCKDSVVLKIICNYKSYARRQKPYKKHHSLRKCIDSASNNSKDTSKVLKCPAGARVPRVSYELPAVPRWRTRSACV
ncbi:MAG: hypothetical protein JSS09_09430 [Verrucomicrobia bacterium]|nr:hypothetical protein [Verrucomicrobiota bacterium]